MVTGVSREHSVLTATGAQPPLSLLGAKHSIVLVVVLLFYCHSRSIAKKTTDWPDDGEDEMGCPAILPSIANVTPICY